MQLKDIKGVGGKTLLKLEKLGINSIDDLVRFMPKFYFDMTKEADLDEVEQGDYVLLKGVVVKKIKTAYINRSLNITKAHLLVGSKKVLLVWYNLPYVMGQIEVNKEYLFWGKISLKDGYTLSNPSFESAENSKRLKGVVPIYPLRGQIGQQQFRNFIYNANLNEVTSICDKYAKMSMSEALNLIHFPQDMDDMRLGKTRFNLEDLITQYIAYKTNKKVQDNNKSVYYGQNREILNEYIKALPFELTNSQKVALDEIISDLKGNVRTNRMLLGDVGSGKTVVSLLCCIFAIKCGYQTAIMVPTEILAEQHFKNAQKLLKDFNFNIKILTSSTSTQEKKEILKELKNGDVDLIVGTHALLNAKVEFKCLSFVVIDELHKFGVKQKGLLEDKTKNCDVLSMSATPIPRAIALTIYGDLQISRLESREGTSDITTNIVPKEKLDDMYKFIESRVKENEQAYIVCPLVLDSEGLEVYSAKMLYKDLTLRKMPNLKIGLIYGSMKESEKSKVMDDFYNQNIDVLIATSVIEVGIDSQNASIMAVLNADRFGLATLHQLRGRVGRRKDLKSYCFLHTSKSEENIRLKALVKYKDGHQIAEYDAQIRGFGDFLGIKQSGMSFKGDALITKELIKESKEIADELLKDKNFDYMSLYKIESYLEQLKSISLN